MHCLNAAPLRTLTQLTLFFLQINEFSEEKFGFELTYELLLQVNFIYTFIKT